MRAFERLLSRLSSLVGIAGMGFLFLMMVHVSADVAGKYLFNRPIPMTLELVASYYMVAIVFLPLGVVTRDHEHLEVELFTQRLAPRPLAAFKAFGCVLGAAYVAVMIWRGVDEALYKTGIGEFTEASTYYLVTWPTRWFYPVGCALMALYLVLQAIDNLAFALRGRRMILHRAEDPAPEVPEAAAK